METINVLVVEPDPLRRRGIVASLSREPGFNVAGAGGDFVEALEASSSSSFLPAVLIINIDNQPVKSMRHWSILRSVLPATRIVALTTGDDYHMLEVALVVGFSALHSQGVDPDVLCRATRNAAQGALDYDAELTERIKRVLIMPEKEKRLSIGGLTLNIQANITGGLNKLACLTKREKQVLALLGEGKTNRQIAQELKITVRTVEFHVTNILKKLGVSSRAEAGLLALWIQGCGQGS